MVSGFLPQIKIQKYENRTERARATKTLQLIEQDTT